MKLIYINFVGKDFRGMNIYQFLYTTQDLKKVTGEDWDSYPAAGNPQSPVDFVDEAYTLETEMTLELIQNHDSFDMMDCQHGVIALAWEDDKEYDDDVYEKRLFFSYGEEQEDVKLKLYARDIHLKKIFENEK